MISERWNALTTPAYVEVALGIPVDEDVLPALGRVVWAAARMQHRVRDTINLIDGEPSDREFKLTLGRAVTALEQRASLLVPEELSALAVWCQTVARPVVKARDKVVHAVAFTAEDGRQGLMTNDHSPPGRFLVPELLEVAGRLEQAWIDLPRPPYNRR